MRRSVLATIDPVSPGYVIAHAMRQQARGRQPSLPFRGIKNPRLALRRAKLEVVRDDLLRFDAFDTAEKLTRASIGTFLGTESLALGLQMMKTRSTRAILSFLNDTHRGISWADYLEIARGEGFETVLAEPFTGRGYSDQPREEKFFILFHRRDGVLLVFDTWGNHINSGHFYYNWLPDNLHQTYRYLSSGGFEKADGRMIWAGDHDCREALCANLSNLRGHGKFVTPWKAQPFLWLLNYMDTKKPGYDYRAINEIRIGQLPDYVRTAIRPN